MKLNIDGVSRTGKIVLDIEDLSKAFGKKNLFDNLSFTLFYKDKLCIMGENGSGKTTFLKILLGEMEPNKGSIKIGSNVSIGYLPQNVTFENEELSILDYYSSKHRLTQSEARKELAKMLFIRDDVFKKINSLSGGEKSRLRLASLIFDKVNLMILDEPTNHLDIDSREVLEDTLSNYDGTIIFVSHDRYFVNKLATKILIIDGHKSRLYPYCYEDYLEIKKKLEIDAANKEKDFKAPKKQQVKPEKKQNNAYKINKLEENIAVLEEKLEIVTGDMEKNSDNADKLYELYTEKEELENELIEAYEELEKLKN